MKQGDIIVLPFPFTNLTTAKLRPAVIVSNKTFNNKKNIVVLAISTKQGVQEFSLPITQNDLDSGKLQKDSFIRFHNILSLEKRLVVHKVGRLNARTKNSVLKQFQNYFSVEK